VTVGRGPDGLYHWEERPGPDLNKDKRNSVPPFRVVLASPEDEPPAPGVAEIDADMTSYRGAPTAAIPREAAAMESKSVAGTPNNLTAFE